MKKRGQFFLIAALVIIGIISSLSAVHNRARPALEDFTVFDLSKEISYESNQIIDSGIMNGLTDVQIGQKIETIADFYAKKNQESDIIIVYGNETDVTFITYNNTEVGTVGISFGGPPITFPSTVTQKSNTTVPRLLNNVTVNFGGGIDVSFDLRTGQTFFVVLKKEKPPERFIALPENAVTIVN